MELFLPLFLPFIKQPLTLVLFTTKNQYLLLANARQNSERVVLLFLSTFKALLG